MFQHLLLILPFCLSVVLLIDSKVGKISLGDQNQGSFSFFSGFKEFSLQREKQMENDFLICLFGLLLKIYD